MRIVSLRQLGLYMVKPCFRKQNWIWEAGWIGKALVLQAFDWIPQNQCKVARHRWYMLIIYYTVKDGDRRIPVSPVTQSSQVDELQFQ